MNVKTNVLLAILGIAATFAATFLGVYLGSSTQENLKRQENREAYISLMSIMKKDCDAALELTRFGRDAVDEGFVPQPTLLLSAFYQNSLLMEQMSSQNVKRLAPALGRIVQHGNRYMRKIQSYDAVRVPPDDPRIAPKEMRNAILNEKNIIATELGDIVNDYSESLTVICEIISIEAKE